ncbi:hypothetical protein FE257_008433 [Aspergillus nanangensis]|uniref:Cytochrome P450 monooxygenase n=1 Tax=Aspergillus nanangensis TaxID=2582783 RepID=A0AAD4CLE0_ASPNN|nr:hypothetical protein FE257_008433 [Aspergillus nanangensis]
MAGIPFNSVYVAIAVYTTIKSNGFGSFFLLSIIASLTRVFYNLVLYPDFFSSIKHIPSPSRRSWLTGNTTALITENPFEEMRVWLDEVPNDGLIRYYITGNMERILLTRPKALSELLVQKVYDFPKPEFIRGRLAPITGPTGLLLVEGDEHKKQRKNLMPAFAYRHIKNLYPVFWSKSTEMAIRIEKELQSRADPEDNVIQVGAWAARTTLDIIGVAGMDNDFNSLQDPDNHLTKTYHKVLADLPLYFKIVFVFGMIIGIPNLALTMPFKINRETRESSEVIRNVARQMIRQKKEKLENKSAQNSVDIVSVALESGTFTEEELVDQMMTFLGAGHETTSTALQWAMYRIAKHPDMQARLRDEVRTHLPPITTEDPQPVSAATLDSLPYLNAFCNETLRFHPSVPATVRVAACDTTIVGQHIPKGTLFMVAPEVVNRSKDLWGADADEFNPERWLAPGRANTGGATSNYGLLTFIHGPRSCIGQGFAKAELACMVATLVGKFEMELKDPDAKLQVRLGATVCPKDGVVARFTPVKGW